MVILPKLRTLNMIRKVSLLHATNHLIRFLLATFVVGSIMGYLLGFVICLFGGMISPSFFDGIGLFAYPVLGIPTAWFCIALSYTGIYNYQVKTVLITLSVSTLIFAVIPTIYTYKWGATPFSWIGGFLGYWVAYFCLRTDFIRAKIDKFLQKEFFSLE